MRRLLTVLAAAVPLMTAAVYLPSAAAEPENSASTTFRCTSTSIPLKAPAGTKIESLTAVSRPTGTVEIPPSHRCPGRRSRTCLPTAR